MAKLGPRQVRPAAPESPYRHQDLREFAVRILQGAGADDEDATTVAGALVESDLRGVHSHGLQNLPRYARALADGVIPARPARRFDQRAASVGVLDAAHGLGHPAAAEAMRASVEMARATGVGIVNVVRSNHFGAAFNYPLIAVASNMIGFITTNTPAIMPAWGGRSAAVGNNPLSWGIPTRDDPPVVLDMACSSAARGKLTTAARAGERIPLDWAFDADGKPTDDPARALDGWLQPVGGPKGYGLAVINEILSAALGPSLLLLEVPRGIQKTGYVEASWDIGHFVMAIDPDPLIGIDAFKDRVEHVRRSLHTGDLASGSDGIRLPGEPEHQLREERMRSGVPLLPATVESLRALDPDFPGVAPQVSRDP